MKIKVSKTILEASILFQAKNDVRFYLNGVLFKKNGEVCAANGHYAIICDKHQSEIDEDVIVSIGARVTKAYSNAIIDTESGVVEYLNLDEQRVAIGLCDVINGKFPDMERINTGATKKTDLIGFNAQYLQLAAKAAKLFNPEFSRINFSLNGDAGCAFADVGGYSGEESARIIVMPMRV